MSNAETRSLRERRAQATREAIIDAAVTLVEAGEEPSMRSTAEQAAISERTIYRYFSSLEELLAVLCERYQGRATATLPDDAADMETYVRELYAAFERDREMVQVYGSARWAAGLRKHSRSRNLRMLHERLSHWFPDAPAPLVDAAASALRVQLSGGGWEYLRIDCQLSAEKVLSHAKLALQKWLSILAAG